MARTTTLLPLEPITFTPPTRPRDPLQFSFRLPSAAGNSNSSSSNPLKPATALQFAFSNVGGQEVFGERLTARDVVIVDDETAAAAAAAEDSGSESDADAAATAVVYRVKVPGSEVPSFRTQQPGDVRVSLHAWKGEKWMGSWEVGTY